MSHPKTKKADPNAHPESQDAFDTTYCTVHCWTHDPAEGCPYCNAAEGAPKPQKAAKAKGARKPKPKAG